MVGPASGEHAVTVAEHVHRVDGARDVRVQRHFVVVRAGDGHRRGRPVGGGGGGGGIIDESERERAGRQTEADGHQIRGHETHVDHHAPVDEHAEYATDGDGGAQHAVLDGPPFVRRGVRHVRVDAVEQHRRAARERHEQRLHRSRGHRRHRPPERTVRGRCVRGHLPEDRQQYERPPAPAVPVAPRAREQRQHGGHQLLDQRLPPVDRRHHVLRLRLVRAARAHALADRSRRVTRLVQQQVRAQAVGEHHRHEVHEHDRLHRHVALHLPQKRHFPAPVP